MKNFLICRRTFISVLGILSTSALGYFGQYDVGIPIALMVGSLCAANAAEGALKARATKMYKDE